MDEFFIERLGDEFTLIQSELANYCACDAEFSKIVKINEKCNELLKKYGRFNRMFLSPVGLVTPEDYIGFADRIRKLELNKKIALDMSFLYDIIHRRNKEKLEGTTHKPFFY